METPGREAGPRAALRVLRSRNFAPYFVGNAASASGTWFHNLAAAILVYRLTHSPFLLGVLSFSQFVPVLVLSPWAGTLADRFDRRRLLLVTQVVAAGLSAVLAALAWADAATATVVIVFSFVLGVTSAFSAPASLALIVQLVDEDDVPQAVALNAMTYNLARVLGPVSAAAVIKFAGIPPAFALNACSYLVLAGALLLCDRASRSGTHARPCGSLSAPAARADARRVPADRDGGRLRVGSDQHRGARVCGRVRPLRHHGRRDRRRLRRGRGHGRIRVAGRVAGSRRRMAGTLTLLGSA